MPGSDATALHDDPHLPGHVWAAPYVVHEPDHGWPRLRLQYPLGVERRPADAESVRLIHSPPVAADDVVATYPSHLHIDLLPTAQGRGAARRLIDTLLAALVSAGTRGVHLGVDPRNQRAIGFYEAIGFTRLSPGAPSAIFGRRLE